VEENKLPIGGSMTDEQMKMAAAVGFVVWLFVLLIFFLSSCTISFQNISTNGRASDLVDENQEATADVQAEATIPITP
jgi:hypothetical protein